MARVERPVLTVTAPNGEQVPVAVFALPVEEDELVPAAEFFPFEEEEKKIPAVVASGPTDAGKYLPELHTLSFLAQLLKPRDLGTN
ncbi:hypothetical protein SNK05_013353 [Fusarium graminearum]